MELPVEIKAACDKGNDVLVKACKDGYVLFEIPKKEIARISK